MLPFQYSIVGIKYFRGYFLRNLILQKFAMLKICDELYNAVKLLCGISVQLINRTV